jgi:hypothetical protein
MSKVKDRQGGWCTLFPPYPTEMSPTELHHSDDSIHFPTFFRA